MTKRGSAVQGMAVLLAAAQISFAAELPVREVVLYKHGVGFFERAGEVKAGESARLDFNANEMNDVLKSLTVNDRSGGKISGIRYDSSEPLSVKLGEFPFALQNGGSLAGFLDQCKGAKVEVAVGRDMFTGQVVGARTTEGKAGVDPQELLTLLLDSGEIRVISLSSATAVRFTDPELQKQLKDYLTALSVARSKEKRSVYIDGLGSAASNLEVSYMVPTPIWKSSYRLLLSDNGEASLEGWAIVDNTSGEDWNHVSLALVSGQPVSFISPLYEPRYRTRPVAELQDDAAAAPTVYEGEVSDMKTVRANAMPPPPAPAAPNPLLNRQMQMAQLSMSKSLDGAPLRDAEYRIGSMNQSVMVTGASSTEVTADGREAGELFEYRFGTPVTVKKSESAMLPFLRAKISSRKLLVYSANSSSTHPQNAAELVNTSGKTLDGGPMTVYEAQSYAGEGLIDTLKQGDRRYIGYSVDLGTRISTKFDNSAQVVREIHANRGTLTTKTAFQQTKTFTIRNVDPKAKTLVIEHPVRQDFKLMSPAATTKTTFNYRFEVKLDGEKTSVFPVVEENLLEQSTSIANLGSDLIAVYLKNKNLPAAGQKQLQQFATLKNQIADADLQIRDLETQINNLNQDQNRVRQNMNSLNQVRNQQDLVQKYATALADQEVKLVQLRDRQTEIRTKKAALENQLSAFADKMDF